LEGRATGEGFGVLGRVGGEGLGNFFSQGEPQEKSLQREPDRGVWGAWACWWRRSGGLFFTGRATGEELTERACQRRVGCWDALVRKVWGIFFHRESHRRKPQSELGCTPMTST